TIQPDLTLYFDVSVEVGQQRVSQLKSVDRFEQEQKEFFQRVRTAYLERARQFPERIRLIDASRPLPEVQIAVQQTLHSLFAHA
ncbi:MAG: dTMP kinase, partial [Pseudomonadota bacterium]